MRLYTSSRSLLFILSAASLVVAFQNCSPGFKTNENSLSSTSALDSNEVPTPTEPSAPLPPVITPPIAPAVNGSIYDRLDLSQALHVGSGQTYAKIVDAITAAKAGDVIVVHAGTYFESGLKPKSGLSVDKPTTIVGAPNEALPMIDAQGTANVSKPIFQIDNAAFIQLANLALRDAGVVAVELGPEISAQNIVIDGLSITQTNQGGDECCNPAGIFIGYHGDTHHITIKNSYFQNGYAAGIKLDARVGHGSNILIDKNTFEGNSIGVHIKWGTSNVNRSIKIQNNLFLDSVGAHNIGRAISVDQDYVEILNNVFYNRGVRSGIMLAENFTASHSLVSHNTFINSDIDAARAYSTGITFRDNILHRTNKTNYYTSPLMWTNNFENDPGFVDLNQLNFKLVPASPAINAATDGTNQGVNF